MHYLPSSYLFLHQIGHTFQFEEFKISYYIRIETSIGIVSNGIKRFSFYLLITVTTLHTMPHITTNTKVVWPRFQTNLVVATKSHPKI